MLSGPEAENLYLSTMWAVAAAVPAFPSTWHPAYMPQSCLGRSASRGAGISAALVLLVLGLPV